MQQPAPQSLARLKDGTELVRIGRPLLPEFAAWRYGRQLRQRARRAAMIVGGTSGVATVASIGTVIAGSGVTGGVAIALSIVPVIGNLGFVAWMAGRKLPRVALRETDGKLWGISAHEMSEARIGLTPDARLRVTIRDQPLRTPGLLSRLTRAPYGWDKSSAIEPRTRDVSGEDAMSLLRLALPTAHRDGGSRADVQAAVEHVESRWIGRDEPAEQVVAHWLASAANGEETTHEPAHGRRFGYIPAPLRLAAEIALQDDDERRALAGELGTL